MPYYTSPAPSLLAGLPDLPDLRIQTYGEAIEGRALPAATWNLLAAAAATALGIEQRSILGTVSGAAWIVSQLEAWVDEPKAGTGGLDWKTVVSLGILAVPTIRAFRKPSPWRWV